MFSFTVFQETVYSKTAELADRVQAARTAAWGNPETVTDTLSVVGQGKGRKSQE